MGMRSKLITLWWADYIYRKLNNEEVCDRKWWPQIFILE